MELRPGRKISTNNARQLVLAMARYGDNSSGLPNDTSDHDIRAFFASRGYDLSQIIEEARIFPTPIPLVENLLGGAGDVISEGGGTISVSKVHAAGHIERLFDGPRQVVFEPSAEAFASTIRYLNMGVARFSIEEVLAASERGVASVQGFIAERAHDWNLINPHDLLVDDAAHKIPFAQKIDEWIPKISGRVFDKSGVNWANFQKIKKFRDKRAAHQDGKGFGLTRREFAETANLFSSGIAGLLFDLHRHFGLKIPSKIIRFKFAPSFILEN